jgi:hypothetical protein
LVINRERRVVMEIEKGYAHYVSVHLRVRQQKTENLKDLELLERYSCLRMIWGLVSGMVR